MSNIPKHLACGSLLQGGKYRIVRFIAAGGFGCTYEAEHVMLRKRMAIKEFFMQDYCNREADTCHVTVGTQSMLEMVNKYKRKFIDEARALSELHHDGIVSVSDVFEENGTAYFVMEYVSGHTLGDLCKSEPLPEKHALFYIRQVCEALTYVHDNGRLHLDIKPGNVIIEQPSGRAVLIDFGASKQYDAESGENTTTLLGYTPGFAPPEQMGGNLRFFSPATDIYALGATLYKLLTGQAPPTATERISGVPLADLPSGVSSVTRSAVFRALQPDKSKRPQTVRELIALLDNAVRKQKDDKVKPIFKVEELSDKSADINKPAGEDGRPQKMRKIMTMAGVAVLVALVVVFAIRLLPGGTSHQGGGSASTASVTEEDMEGRRQVDGEHFTDEKGIDYAYTGWVNEAGRPDDEHGTAVDATGTYKGAFRDGKRTGQGVYETTDGSNRFEGTFEEGQFMRGRLYFSDGSYFEGTFQNNEPSNGDVYDKNGALIDLPA